MGKLHTLKRAVLRDPSVWKRRGAAKRKKGVWVPYSYLRWSGNPLSYYNYVKKVLRECRSP